MNKYDHLLNKIILRRPDVEKLTGLSRSTIYAKMDSGSKYFDPFFPRAIKLGKGAVGWRSNEILKWMDNCTIL